MRRFLTLLIGLGIAAGVLFAPAAAQASFGIDPGKVYIDNLFPGAQADYPITIYNQNDYETTFAVRAREPDYTAEDEGYGVFPYLEWVTVTPERVIIGASDTGEVLITVAMPEDAVYSGKKSEVWISFMEEGTEGMIKIELCSRLFISTRIEETSETPAEAPTEPPTVEGNGAVGITAEPGATEPVSPATEPVSPATEPVSPATEPVSPSDWTILGPVLGGVAGVAVFFSVRRKRRQRV